MKLEVAQQVEKAYQRVLIETLGLLEIEMLSPSDQFIEMQKQKGLEARAALGSFAPSETQLTDFFTWRASLPTEELQENAMELLAADTGKILNRTRVKEEKQRREVLGFVLDGLVTSPKIDGLSEGPAVRFEAEWQVGEGEVKTIPSLESVPDTISLHPITKEQKTPHFAAQTTWIASKLLTPEIVELVTSDETRLEPVLRTEITVVERSNG